MDMMTDETTPATPVIRKCEARTGLTPGEFGFKPVPCEATRGIRAVIDSLGDVHYYCPAPGHGESVAISSGTIAQFLSTPTNHPPRKASPGCESGGHDGCTCDVCF